MTSFIDFLTQRLESGGFTTEDALASFLPLARQTADAHQAGLVAPLMGVNDLRVEGIRIWFEEAGKHAPTLNSARLHALEGPRGQAVEVVGRYRFDVSGPDEGAVDLDIGARGT